VPNPMELHGYVDINGVVACATATASPLGENATPLPVDTGSVAGSAYFVPNPMELHGYANINGEIENANAMLVTESASGHVPVLRAFSISLGPHAPNACIKVGRFDWPTTLPFILGIRQLQ